MKMWRNLTVAAVAIAAAAACSKRSVTDEIHAIVIDPTVTRASELSFDNGDRIGLTVIKSGDQTPYLSNALLTCNGSMFVGSGVEWYADRTKNAAFRAYYPYDANGEPTAFTVQTDQRGNGYTLSDFMSSSKMDVAPTAGAVAMIFRHQLAKINIYIKNNTQAFITETGIASCALTANVSVAAGSATACETSQKAAVVAHETTPQEKYNAIIAPQTAALTFYVKLDDGSLMRSVAMNSAEYAGGKQFTARLTINDDRLDVTLSGEIEGWGDNTDLTPDNSTAGGDTPGPGDDQNSGDDNTGGVGGKDDPGSSGDDNTGGSVSWGGVDYPTVTLADGSTWMACNLRYVPAGKSVSADPSDGRGVWYPCNESKQPSADESFIAEHGYLYSAEAAHGGSVRDGEAAVRGICPEGWHLPTEAEFKALKAAYPKTDDLQASVFGVVFGGCINATGNYFVNDNQKEMHLWGSTVRDGETCCLLIDTKEYSIKYRTSFGASVRCVKDN